eukprot:1742325-Rhodomonas_salina.1
MGESEGCASGEKGFRVQGQELQSLSCRGAARGNLGAEKRRGKHAHDARSLHLAARFSLTLADHSG